MYGAHPYCTYSTVLYVLTQCIPRGQINKLLSAAPLRESANLFFFWRVVGPKFRSFFSARQKIAPSLGHLCPPFGSKANSTFFLFKAFATCRRIALISLFSCSRQKFRRFRSSTPPIGVDRWFAVFCLAGVSLRGFSDVGSWSFMTYRFSSSLLISTGHKPVVRHPERIFRRLIASTRAL